MMNELTLGIDTSGVVCSVALVSGETVVSEFSINHKKTHSAMLLPMISSMLQQAEIELSDISLITVAKGPGSFTGLRIGAATAKGLAFATGIPLVGVSTLLGLAYNLKGEKRLVCPIMDARRSEVYTAIYRDSGSDFTCIKEPSALPISELIEDLNNRGESVAFLGDGVPVYREEIKESLSVDFSFAPEGNLLQRASSIAVLGRKIYSKKDFKEAPLQLTYLRRPQAERERLLSLAERERSSL